jgi:hypothetical protein
LKKEEETQPSQEQAVHEPGLIDGFRVLCSAPVCLDVGNRDKQNLRMDVDEFIVMLF